MERIVTISGRDICIDCLSDIQLSTYIKEDVKSGVCRTNRSDPMLSYKPTTIVVSARQTYKPRHIVLPMSIQLSYKYKICPPDQMPHFLLKQPVNKTLCCSD
jgi:hypothetical protein